jgi:hypothetical protein
MAYTYESNGDIVISGWEVGISNSPYQTQTNTALVAQGVSDMRNVDIITVPGEASVAMATVPMITQASAQNVTFTVNAASDIFTYNGTIPLEVNTCITVANSGGGLPGGMAAGTPYYIKQVLSATTFTVSAASAGGIQLDVTTTGTGTQTFSTIDMGTPLYFDSYLFASQYYLYFLQDSNGRIWVYNQAFPSFLNGTGKWVYMNSYVTSESSLNTANGLAVYSGYLFFFTQGAIHVMSIFDFALQTVDLAHLTTRSSWTFNWKGLSGNFQGISHQALVSQLNQLLICNANGLAVLGIIPGSLIASTTSGTAFSLAETHSVTDGVTTNNSSSISTVSAFFTATDVGAVIVGSNIPAGTVVISVTNNTHAVLSNNCSGSGSALTFTITKSYSYQIQGLILPDNETATCLAELGGSVLVGGINNLIYPWDEVSISYDALIRCAENYTYQMVTVNTTTYIFSGTRGRIYVTNGSNVQLFAKMPDHISGTVNPIYSWYGVLSNRNQVYFGVSATDNAGTTISQYGGVWGIDTDTKALRMVNQLSYGTYAGYASALIANRGPLITSSSANTGYGLFTGWYSGTVGGIDQGTATPYTGGQAYVETDIVPVGTYINKKTFSNLEYKLAAPLAANESVSLQYRTNVTEAYTVIPITEGNGTGDVSGYGPANFQNVQWVQLRAYLTSTANSPSYVRLKELRIRD